MSSCDRVLSDLVSVLAFGFSLSDCLTDTIIDNRQFTLESARVKMRALRAHQSTSQHQQKIFKNNLTLCLLTFLHTFAHLCITVVRDYASNESPFCFLRAPLRHPCLNAAPSALIQSKNRFTICVPTPWSTVRHRSPKRRSLWSHPNWAVTV